MGVVGRSEHVPVIRDDLALGKLEGTELARENDPARGDVHESQLTLKKVGFNSKTDANITKPSNFDKRSDKRSDKQRKAYNRCKL